MLTALMLIFRPALAWERIENAQRSVVAILFQFLVPLMLLSAAVEGFGLLKLGEERRTVDVARLEKVPPELAVRYEATQLGLSLIIIVGGAWVLQHISSSFHRSHNYKECFTTLAYALSPLFLLRMLDGVPQINTWICWAIGVALSVAALYRGIPRTLRPDPSSALGLYLVASLVVIMGTGLAHLLAVLVLNGQVLRSGLDF